jgi:predicted ATPase
VGLLLERWAEVKEGQGHVILLSGEAGRIGYSKAILALPLPEHNLRKRP